MFWVEVAGKRFKLSYELSARGAVDEKSTLRCVPVETTSVRRLSASAEHFAPRDRLTGSGRARPSHERIARWQIDWGDSRIVRFVAIASIPGPISHGCTGGVPRRAGHGFGAAAGAPQPPRRRGLRPV
ncbi:MAG: hypothetical protein AW10_00808 [Candidatus Accumulibacter appositus]|uniref:Uncharacterized protein n=1 Tax=Candidatus Accumulibacter appositus TaxID=1454003 RepID=A0A011PYR4_9PROT|nr:MAG: hypothetical protein AW10_00808 [Candidatus Accumulibacter appositus]